MARRARTAGSDTDTVWSIVRDDIPGVRVPQQAMASVFSQLDERWAVTGHIGWQQWPKFGEVEAGVENTLNSRNLNTAIDFKDTWHFAAGAQYKVNDPWKLNFGVAYDSGFQSGSNVSPLLPVNAAWGFGVGGEQQVSRTMKWGIAGELLYGGTLDVDKRSTLPPALGGRGDLVGHVRQHPCSWGSRSTATGRSDAGRIPGLHRDSARDSAVFSIAKARQPWRPACARCKSF